MHVVGMWRVERREVECVWILKNECTHAHTHKLYIYIYIYNVCGPIGVEWWVVGDSVGSVKRGAWSTLGKRADGRTAKGMHLVR